MIYRGPNTAHGRGTPVASLGALTTALDGMSAGQWLNWTASTNVQPITDTSCADGQPYAWLESLGNYYLTNWPGKATWDDTRKQVLITGTAQGLASEVPAGQHSSAVYLDVTTGTFSKTWNPMGANLAHVYDSNCSRPIGNKVYRSPYGSSTLYECDLTTRVWTSIKTISSLSLGSVNQIDVFPEMGASGSVLMLNDAGKLCRWDIATDALSTIGTYGGMGSYPSIHYCAGYVVFGGGSTGTTFRKIDSAGTVTTICAALTSGLTGTGAGVNTPVCADPSGLGKSFAFVPAGNTFSLDHASGTWTDHGAVSGINVNSPVCAIQGHGAFLFLVGAGRANSSTSNCQVWLYKAP